MPTKEGKPSLLIAQDKTIPKDRFFIGIPKKAIDEGEELLQDNVDIVMAEDSSLGSRFFGWGIIKAICEKGGQAVLMTSKGKELKLPGEDEV